MVGAALYLGALVLFALQSVLLLFAVLVGSIARLLHLLLRPSPHQPVALAPAGETEPTSVWSFDESRDDLGESGPKSPSNTR
jgi:hypothetical protein